MVTHTLPTASGPVSPEYLARLAELERLAVLFDARWRIPWTRIDVGIDPIVGLIPILGDLAMAAAGARLILIARRLGASGTGIGRMVLNLTIDVVIGIVPLAGPVFDVFYRANLRNLDILAGEIARSREAATPEPEQLP